VPGIEPGPLDHRGGLELGTSEIKVWAVTTSPTCSLHTGVEAKLALGFVNQAPHSEDMLQWRYGFTNRNIVSR
jgi:hypothetical protein